MRRNPVVRQREATEQAIRRATTTPAQQAQTGASADSGRVAGAVDAGGAFQPYGRFGRTTFGSGFRFSGRVRE